MSFTTTWNLPKGLKIAGLPENIEELSEMDQKVVRDNVAKNMVIYHWAVVTCHAPYYYYTLTDAYTTLFAALAQGASLLWGAMFHIVHTICYQLIVLNNLA